MATFQLSVEPRPIKPSHLDVAQDHVVPPIPQLLQGECAISDDLCGVAIDPEEIPERLCHVAVIIDDKNGSL